MNANDRPVEPSGPDGRFSRRGFLAGAAAVSAGAVVGRQAGVAHAEEGGSGLHGAQLRGMFLTTKDRLAEGRFGAMFKRLPAYAPSDDLLTGLANTMVEADTGDSFLNTSPRLFAGFTFIGQFIDHDITLDNTPLAQQQADPTQPSTSARRAMTSTCSTGVGRLMSLSSTIRATRPSCC